MVQQSYRTRTSQGSTSNAIQSAQDALLEGSLQADTVARNALNTATFGLGDKINAAVDASIGLGGPGDWTRRYQNIADRNAARNVYDSIHRGVARRLGEGAGIAIDTAGGAEGGVAWSEALPSASKGALGEWLSAGKTILKRDTPTQFQTIKRLSKGYTRVDHATANGVFVEAKFGPKASLSPRQTQAQAELGPKYRVDWWLPKHVGYIAGGLGALGGLLGAAHNESNNQNAHPQPR